jgi:ABC-type glycerol-3-phosphate transport system substrate-binding protein
VDNRFQKWRCTESPSHIHTAEAGGREGDTQYPELQDLIGGAINAVLAGQADPKAAMDDIQAKAEALFK